MPNADNLKKGNPETEFRGRFAVEAQKKSAEKRKQNNSLRKLGQQMLTTQMEVDAQTLKSIKRMGFDTDKPEMQMILLARLGAIAFGKDPDLTMKAASMIMDITGNDVRSINASEQRRLERERIALERERLALERERLAKRDPANAPDAFSRFEDIVEEVRRIE